MLKLYLTPQAKIDLENIYEYTLSTWGFAQAVLYQDELFGSMLIISQSPQIGSTYYHKEGGYRRLNVNRHIIFYRTNQEQCTVVRILHERMKLKR